MSENFVANKREVAQEKVNVEDQSKKDPGPDSNFGQSQSPLLDDSIREEILVVEEEKYLNPSRNYSKTQFSASKELFSDIPSSSNEAKKGEQTSVKKKTSVSNKKKKIKKKSIEIWCAFKEKSNQKSTFQFILKKGAFSKNEVCEVSQEFPSNQLIDVKGLKLFRITHVFQSEKEEFKLQLLQNKTESIVEKCECFRKISENTQNYFVFGLEFAKNGREKFQEIVLEEFLFYSIHLLSNDNLKLFPLLIGQFEENKAKIQLNLNGVNEMWGVLNRFLSNFELTNMNLGVILAIIGEFSSINIRVSEIKSASAKKIVEFIDQYINQQGVWNLAEGFDVEISNSGITSCLLLALLHKSTPKWQDIIEKLDPTSRQQIITEIIEVVTQFPSDFPKNLSSFLQLHLREFDKISLQRVSLKKLCKITEDFREFAKVFKTLYEVCKIEDISRAKESGKEIEYFFKKCTLNFRAILEIIEVLETNEYAEIKTLVYEPYLRLTLEKMFDDSSLIDNISLENISKLFNKNIIHLMRNIKKEEFLQRLITNRNFAFSPIFEMFLDFDIEKSRNLLIVFVEKKVAQKGKESLVDFEKDYSRLEDNYQKKLIEETLQIMKTFHSQKKYFFIEIAPICEKCQSKLMKDCYIKFAFNILKEYQEKPEVVNDLCNILIQSFQNSAKEAVYEQLNKKISSLFSPEQFESEKVQEREKFFTSPTKERGFFMILTSNVNPEMLKCLINFFSTIINDITSFNLTIKEINLILNHSDYQRKAFLAYLTEVTKLNNSTTIIEDIIENLVAAFFNFTRQREITSLYIDRFIENNASDYLKINSDRVKLANELKTQTLCNLHFPKSIKKFEKISNEVYPVVHSEIYKNFYLNSRLSQKNPLTSDEIIAITNEAFQNMSSEMANLFSDIGAFRLSRFKIIVSVIKFHKEELEILKNFKNARTEVLQIFKELIDFLFRVLNLEEFCKALLELQNLIKFQSKKVLKICENYIQTCVDNQKSITCNEYLDCSKVSFAKLTLNYNEVQIKPFIDLVVAINSSPDLVKFCNQLKTEEVEYLIESVNDFGGEHITAQEIINFREVWKYINWFCEETKYKKIVKSILEMNQNKIKELILIIMVCSSQISQIKQLHMELNLKEAAKKKQIIDIFVESAVTFVKVKGKLDIKLVYSVNKGKSNLKPMSIGLDALLELKDRASFVKNANEEGEDEEVINRQMKGFIAFVGVIATVIDTLGKLERSGYPDVSPLEKAFPCIQGNFQSAAEYEEALIKKLNRWNASLNKAYLTYRSLPYLHGKQFWLLEKYFTGKLKEKHQTQAKNLLKYLGKIHNNEKLIGKSAKEINTRLEQLASFIENLQDINLRNEIDLYNTELNLKQKVFHKSGQVLCIETTDILQGILTLFVQAKYLFPSSDQIIYCSSGTSIRELKSFIHRCFQNKKNQLYLMVNCENLSIEIQKGFIECFKFLDEECVNENYRLGLLCALANCEIVDFFRYHNKIVFIRIKDIYLLDSQAIKSIVGIADQTSVVYTSLEAGFGKTAMIESSAKKERKSLEVFPISGEVSLALLTKRLCQIQFSEPTVLLLKVNFNTDSALVNQLIMNLSLFKTIVSDNKVFIIPNNVELHIEVANSYDNSLYKELDYLKYLKQSHIKNFSISRLKSYYNKRGDLNYVGNYLKLAGEGRLDTTEISYKDSKNIELISDRELRILMQNAIAHTRNTIENFTLLDSFLKFLAYSLKCFEDYPFFNLSILADLDSNYRQFIRESAAEIRQIRSTVFNAMLESSTEFTTKSINRVKKNQTEANQGKGLDENSYLNSDCNVTWESSNHFMILFTPMGDVLFIYRDHSKVPVNIKKLIYLQSNFRMDPRTLSTNLLTGNYQIEDYSTLSHYDFLVKLKVYANHRNIEDELLEDQYILTPDNYLKMNLIYARALAKLPIVIMGETGVGKTSLLRFCITKVLQEHLEIFSIHAGITMQGILSRMSEFVAKAKAKSDSRVWVFFDEFNTNDNIALLSEVLCGRTLNSVVLPENMVFAAACNPYRLKSKKIQFDQNVGIKQSRSNSDKSTKLLHFVKPLPDNVIQYIYDFGSLTQPDFLMYLKNMLKQTHSKHNILFANLIVFAHQSLQGREDSSSVSLRDVARFIRLNNWFVQSRIQKGKIQKTALYKETAKKFKLDCECSVKENDLIAGILAFCHCYYLRISSEDERKNFLQNMENISKRLVTVEQIGEILLTEQNDYFARMELQEGIALNKALRENVFAIIPCIFEHIPIFICGKPGCSKSLSISLVFSNLRGEKSKDPYFKTLPEIIHISYQGSESSTSESILKVFERAEKFLHTTSADKLLPVVIFDEIGLAEISKHNPLKVLHSLLELENNKIGFIGISNWRLDASKMNRVLYLARPDPDRNELILTALSIYDSYHIDDKNFREMVKILSESYFELKTFYKAKYEDFYGLRDFYNMIKLVSVSLYSVKVKGKLELVGLAKNAIERNFGGILKAAEKMGQIFMKKFNVVEEYLQIPKKSAIDLITENLSDKNSRYLMIFSNREVGAYILHKQLEDTVKSHRFIAGSTLINDLTHEEYAFRCLNQILFDIEKGNSIILYNIDQIYSSLYDLFNQNFSIQGDRKYCRIALGAILNPRSFVHDSFRVIIFVEDDLEIIHKIDPPFLNRFEKHYLEIDEFLSETELRAAKTVIEWVKKLISVDNTPINKAIIFPTYSKKSVKLDVSSFASPEMDQNRFEFVVAQCKLNLLQASPSDILILAKLANIELSEQEFIAENWKKIHQAPFYKYLIDENESKTSSKILILTYQSNYNAKIFNSTMDNLIYSNKISSFKSEKEFDKEMRNFITSRQVFCIIELDYTVEPQHLAFLKFKFGYFYDEFQKDIKGKKFFIILLTLSRSLHHNKSIPIMHGWTQIMFDKLETVQNRPVSSRKHVEINENILSLNTKQLILKSEIFNFTENFAMLIENALLRFNPSSSESYIEYIYFVLENIRKDNGLIAAFENKIKGYFEKMGDSRLKDWKKQIFLNKEIVSQSKDVHNAIFNCIYKELENAFVQLVYFLEKSQAFASYFFSYGEAEDLELKSIWKENFEGCNIDIDVRLQNLNSSNKIEKHNFTLLFPFSCTEFDKIQKIYNEYNENNEIPNALSKTKFRESFSKVTVLKTHINSIERYAKLQELYIKDIIKLILTSNNLEIERVDLVYALLKCSYQQDEFFELKILNLFNSGNIFMIIICSGNIARSYCKENVFDLLETTIERSEESLIQLANEENFLDSNENLDEISQFYNRKFKESTLLAFNELCKFMLPERSILEQIDLTVYLNLLKNFINLAFSFKQMTKTDLKYYDTVEFLAKFLAFAIATKTSLENILRISKRLLKDGTVILNKDEKKIFLFSCIEIKAKSEAKEEVFKFEMFYYNALFLKSCDVLAEIAENIDKTDLWSHSKRFFGLLAVRLDILETIVGFDEEIMKRKRSGLTLQRNEYYISLLEIIKSLSLNSRFCILLVDTFEQLLFKYIDADFMKCTYAYRMLKYYMRIYKQNQLTDSVLAMVAISKIKISLRIYVNEIVTKMPSDDYQKKIDNLLYKNTPFSNTFKLYTTKLLQMQKSLDQKGLIKLMNSLQIRWMKTLNFTMPSHRLSIYPFMAEFAAEYSELVKAFEKLQYEEGNHDLDAFLSIPNRSLIVALLFLNEIFVMHMLTESPIQVYKDWWFQARKISEKGLGNEMTLFLDCMVKNFPESSSLRIKPRMGEKRVHRIFYKCFVFILVLHQRNSNSPLTSLFFNEKGCLHNDLNSVFRSRFGLCRHPGDRLRETRYKLIEFNSIKGTATYKCSSRCDYIYFIENCGKANNNPSHKNVCPLDKAPLGGANHNLIHREGHCKLTDEQAKAHLQACILKYQSEIRPGLIEYKSSDITEDRYLTDLKPITFNLLGSFTNTVLSMLIEIGSIKSPNMLVFSDDFSNTEKNKIQNDNCRKYLSRSVNKQIKKAEKVLESLGCQEPIAWIYKVVSMLPQVIHNKSTDCKNWQSVKNFEGIFEKQVVDSNLLAPSNTVLTYKKSLISRSVSIENYLSESEIDEYTYPLSQQFRIKSTPNEQSIIDIFYNTVPECKRSSDYFLVQEFFDTKEKIKQLQCLFPIIKFTNYLLQEYDHRISRIIAQSTPITEIFTEDKPEALTLFEDFTNAWENLSVDSLQYDCHVLEKIKISSNTPLSIFLLDNKEQGGGMHMVAAIIFLSESHNKILESILLQMQFINQKKECLLDNKKYSPQSINAENILDFDIVSSDQLSEFYMNHWEYGKGSDVIYDFDKLQDSICTEIYKKKFINVKRINFIQYQFEMLSISGENSNTISEVRTSIKQKELEGKDVKRIENFMDMLKGEVKLRFSEKIKEIYADFCYILYYIKNTREKPEMLLREYCTSLKTGKKMSIYLSDERNLLGNFELRVILDIFSLVEVTYFPYFCENILKDEYKNADQEKMIKQIIKEVISKGSRAFPSLEEIKIAFLRFLIRCSAADLDVKQPINQYIEREDFWKESMDDERITNLKEVLGSELAISNSLCFYNSIAIHLKKESEGIDGQRDEGLKSLFASNKNKQNNLIEKKKKTVKELQKDLEKQLKL